VATQLVNLESWKKLEVAGFGSQGKTVGHELLEGYYGAIQNPRAGENDRGAYYQAHSKSNQVLPMESFRLNYNETTGEVYATPLRLSPFPSMEKRVHFGKIE
jgi:hypothetical protein